MPTRRARQHHGSAFVNDLRSAVSHPHNRSAMKFDSPIFDRIRVKPGEDRRVRPGCPVCDWPGCREDASHRAPKGRLREGEYWRFCLEHVREYNQSYNFFAGMSDDAVAQYQKEAITGHRPTWKMGVNGSKPNGDPGGFGERG